VSGLGDTLRGARERRGEDLTAAAEAIGADPAHLEALEAEQLDRLPEGDDRAALVERYARHLELDPAWLAAELELLERHDPDADTQPIPLPTSRIGRRDSALIWLGAGVLLGVGALVLLGGGLGSDSSQPTSAASSPATTARGATTVRTGTTAAAPQVLKPQPSGAPAIDLRLGARAGKTVWVEVRRGGVSGPQLYAGIVGGRTTKRIRSSTTLWLGVAWAPNLTVSVNDEELDAEGGTESYLVTARGLRRLTNQ
jgi:cytoskeletal protein RodZ